MYIYIHIYVLWVTRCDIIFVFFMVWVLSIASRHDFGPHPLHEVVWRYLDSQFSGLYDMELDEAGKWRAPQEEWQRLSGY